MTISSMLMCMSCDNNAIYEFYNLLPLPTRLPEMTIVRVLNGLLGLLDLLERNQVLVLCNHLSDVEEDIRDDTIDGRLDDMLLWIRRNGRALMFSKRVKKAFRKEHLHNNSRKVIFTSIFMASRITRA